MGVKTFVLAQWDRVMAWVAVAIGVLVLLIGWLGVSDTPFVFEQMPYIVSGGIGGLFLLGVGAMMWLSADLRDEWRKLDSLEVALWQSAAAQEPVEELDELTELPLPVQPATTSPRRSRQTVRKS